jgi:hypothetical protein
MMGTEAKRRRAGGADKAQLACRRQARALGISEKRLKYQEECRAAAAGIMREVEPGDRRCHKELKL